MTKETLNKLHDYGIKKFPKIDPTEIKSAVNLILAEMNTDQPMAHLYRTVYLRLIDYVRKYGDYGRNRKLRKGEHVNIEDVHVCCHDTHEFGEININKLIKHLPKDQQRVIDLIYNEGLRIATVSRTIGKSAHVTKQIHKLAIINLRRHLHGKETGIAA